MARRMEDTAVLVIAIMCILSIVATIVALIAASPLFRMMTMAIESFQASGEDVR
jgi:hypothetical protein